mmetsp:Transcript_74495/g.177715  ORF Transcript_74495/g.177715 Transcript_74495/m.177715 type:complete len:268 (-) Transcript_74495:374-1177(-)
MKASAPPRSGAPRPAPGLWSAWGLQAPPLPQPLASSGSPPQFAAAASWGHPPGHPRRWGTRWPLGCPSGSQQRLAWPGRPGPAAAAIPAPGPRSRRAPRGAAAAAPAPGLPAAEPPPPPAAPPRKPESKSHRSPASCRRTRLPGWPPASPPRWRAEGLPWGASGPPRPAAGPPGSRRLPAAWAEGSPAHRAPAPADGPDLAPNAGRSATPGAPGALGGGSSGPLCAPGAPAASSAASRARTGRTPGPRKLQPCQRTPRRGRSRAGVP